MVNNYSIYITYRAIAVVFNVWSTLLEAKFLIFSLCNCPLHLKRLFFFSLFFSAGGGEQKTAEHRLKAVFKCSSEYAVSHA